MDKIEEQLSHTDTIIKALFSGRWSGDLNSAPIEDMREQLHKTLQNQVDGYWSGRTAYHIAVDGGFLIDSRREPKRDSNMCEGKKLTELGKLFMLSMSNQT